MYKLWLKKTSHFVIIHIVAKYRPILKFTPYSVKSL